jgi:hypothetical protein
MCLFSRHVSSLCEAWCNASRSFSQRAVYWATVIGVPGLRPAESVSLGRQFRVQRWRSADADLLPVGQLDYLGGLPNWDWKGLLWPL